MSDDVEMWKDRAMKEAQKVMGLVRDRRLLAEAIVNNDGAAFSHRYTEADIEKYETARKLAESILNDEPAPPPADRDALADELIAWAADPRNAYTGDWNVLHCRWCKAPLPPGVSFDDGTHVVGSCLHLRARALRGDDG